MKTDIRTSSHADIRPWWPEDAQLPVWLALFLALVAMGAIVILIAVLPWIVGLAVAGAAAGAWCWWLDRHPE